MPPKDINLGADERKAYDRLFENADKEQLGVLTGDKAVPFFEASQLPGQTLGEIWALADDENTGFLTKEAFYVVCRLIGHAQRGQTPSDSLIRKPGSLPYFKGMTVPGLPSQPPASAASTPQKPANSSATSTASLGGLSISPDDKAKYTRLFYNSQPTNGLLDGERARDIFTKSRLSNEKLGQIWGLSDTQGRGALDATDFVIAMTLIQSSMNGSIAKLPDTLPISLYAQASSGPGAEATPGGAQMPASPLRAQGTGSGAPGPLYSQQTGSSLLNRSSAGAMPLSASQRSFSGATANASNWAIDPSEKAESDQFFNMLDTSRQGVIAGEIAVPFFVQSGLPEETLAQIWDLSDMRKEGSLTKEEFAVARRLVMDVLQGKPLPDQLEQNLIPPSLRAIVQQQQAQPQRKPNTDLLGRQLLIEETPFTESEVQRDLFSLMDDDEPSQVPAAAVASGNAAFMPQAGAGARVASPLPMQPTGSSARGTPQPLQPTHTGASARHDSPSHHQSKSPPPPVPAHRSTSGHFGSPPVSGLATQNFFDATPTEEKKDEISAHSAELGNLQNQVRETQRSVSSLRQERTALSSKVSKTEEEIDELKSALAQAKAAFDTESTNMTNLEARFKTGSEELKKLRQELITAESDLSALREQKMETEQNILKDKEESRDLKIKLKASNDEVATLKETLEKLRKDARQQKGMLVVTKKQLTTSEADNEKLQRTISEERELAQAPTIAAPEPSRTAVETPHTVPLPESNVVSPAPSAHSSRSMNPFFNNNTAARVASPLAASAVPVSSAFDDDPFFGTSAPPVAAPQPVAPAQPAGFGFDDDFGSSFNSAPATGPTAEEKGKGKASSSVVPAPATQGQTDFDAAFADFEAPASRSVPAEPTVTAEQPHATESAVAAHEAPATTPAALSSDNEDTSIGTTVAAVAGAAVGAVAGVGAAGLALLSREDNDHKAETTSQPMPVEPETSVVSPSSMQPYESRDLPADEEHEQESDNGDNDEGELAPIRDVEQPDSESDSDTNSDSDIDPEDAGAAPRDTGLAEDSAGPFASTEDEPDTSTDVESASPPAGPAVSALPAESSFTSAPVEDTPEPGTTKGSDPFPGAFPTSRSSNPPSSIGEGDDQFEDAHADHNNDRSTSPNATETQMFPSSGANTETSTETEPLKSSGNVAPSESGAVPSTSLENSIAAPQVASGFDDAFENSFQPATASQPGYDTFPASSTNTVIGSQSLPPIHSASTSPVQVQVPNTAKTLDDFDDFEDLAPAQIESTTSDIPQSNISKSNDFDANFDDDFGFDNQTFSHSNAKQPSGHSKDDGSGGFDDNFENAFAVPAAISPPPTQPASAAAPAPASRAPIVGFDDDFFTSPVEAQPSATQAPFGSGNVSAEPTDGGLPRYDMPPPGGPPVGQQALSSRSGPPPVPPPPQQQQSSLAPPLPTRKESDGELDQVKELVNMGFNKKQAIAALEDNQFDLERAANALLSVNQ